MKYTILFLLISINLFSQSAGNQGIIHRDTGYFNVVKMNGMRLDSNLKNYLKNYLTL